MPSSAATSIRSSSPSSPKTRPPLSPASNPNSAHPMALPNKLNALYLQLKRTLWAAGIATAERDARIIIRQHTDLDWADLIANPDAPIPKTKLPRIEFDIERRLSGMPVSRMYGERAFWG